MSLYLHLPRLIQVHAIVHRQGKRWGVERVGKEGSIYLGPVEIVISLGRVVPRGFTFGIGRFEFSSVFGFSRMLRA